MLLTSWPQSAGSPACSAPVPIKGLVTAAQASTLGSTGSLGVRSFAADRSAGEAAVPAPAPVMTGLPESEKNLKGATRKERLLPH